MGDPSHTAARIAPSFFERNKQEIPMWTGTVDSIHIAPAAKAATQTVDAVEAVPGAGLKGDRYFLKQGTFYKPEPDFELTLIEVEAIEAAAREYKVALAPSAARRNVVTRGVPLNHLVGRDFAIGDVRVRGIRLCEPCGHLEALTGLPVIKALRHRGGLRAQILTPGLIRVGDAVRG
jgi:MOSC domain-containing protein YiiM